MKSFLKYFLILFVAQTFAAADEDLTGQAFDLLAKSVRLQTGKQLTQENFTEAITSLSTFLKEKYLTPKPNNLPTVTIENKDENDVSSPEIEKLLNPPPSTGYISSIFIDTLIDTYINPSQGPLEFCYVVNNICFKGPFIPLICAIKIYADIAQKANPSESINNTIIKKIDDIITTLLNNPRTLAIQTKWSINRLFFIDAQTDDVKCTATINVTALLFKYRTKNFIIDQLKTSYADPLVEGSYVGPNFIDPTKELINIKNKIGFLIFLNSELTNQDIFEIKEFLKEHYFTKSYNSQKNEFFHEFERLDNSREIIEMRSKIRDESTD